MAVLNPVSMQRVKLYNPTLSTVSMTVETIGRFYDYVNDTFDIGIQIVSLSPWTDNAEMAVIDTSTCTLIRDRSSEGKESIYQYVFLYRGIKPGNTTYPPENDVAHRKVHTYLASIIIPTTVEYWTQLENSFTENQAMRAIQAYLFDATTDVSVGDGRGYFLIPEKYNGSIITRVMARVITAGTTGTTEVQIANVTKGWSAVLSTKAIIASGQVLSGTAVVNPSFATVATNDLLRVDIDAVTSTAPKGLLVLIEFEN